MSWADIIDIIKQEAGEKLARRIAERIRAEYGGTRITISKRPMITIEQIEQIAPGRPKEAARQLGVHPTTVYRAIQRTRIVR